MFEWERHSVGADYAIFEGLSSYNNRFIGMEVWRLIGYIKNLSAY